MSIRKRLIFQPLITKSFLCFKRIKITKLANARENKSSSIETYLSFTRKLHKVSLRLLYYSCFYFTCYWITARSTKE